MESTDIIPNTDSQWPERCQNFNFIRTGSVWKVVMHLTCCQMTLAARTNKRGMDSWTQKGVCLCRLCGFMQFYDVLWCFMMFYETFALYPVSSTIFYTPSWLENPRRHLCSHHTPKGRRWYDRYPGRIWGYPWAYVNRIWGVNSRANLLQQEMLIISSYHHPVTRTWSISIHFHVPSQPNVAIWRSLFASHWIGHRHGIVMA